jgi:hypothetical protein
MANFYLYVSLLSRDIIIDTLTISLRETIRSGELMLQKYDVTKYPLLNVNLIPVNRDETFLVPVNRDEIAARDIQFGAMNNLDVRARAHNF